MKRNAFFAFSVFFILTFFLVSAHDAFADSSTTGYAWSENTGWVDFSQVTVSDSTLSGYAYSSNIGWISLNCANTSSCGTTDYKVSNTSGTLSGYAWSENTGYIDFGQVTINTTTGVFSGSAYSSNIGWISLNCANTSSCGTVDYKVTTAWRPPTTHHSSGGHRPITPIAPVIIPPTIPPVVTTCTLNFTQILKLTIPRMNNENVKSLQSCLNTKLPPPLLSTDGIFGPKTKQAVMNFQKANYIKIDGIVGPITRELLIK